MTSTEHTASGENKTWIYHLEDPAQAGSFFMRTPQKKGG
jgi:hypothetical protein